MRQRQFCYAGLIITISCVMSACGNKGDLYRPAEAPVTVEQPADKSENATPAPTQTP